LVSGKLPLALASTVILGSVSYRTHDHIFLPHDSGSYVTTPFHLQVSLVLLYSFFVDRFKKSASNSSSTVVSIVVATDMFQQAAV
jgi:hypothetical protein